MDLVLLGAPGSGKGTQAEHLRREMGLMHIASGDLFRDHLERKTELGMRAAEYMTRGALVPDAITIDMLRELRAPPASGGLPPGTPFAILGDFNAYHTDPARHVETLLTGAIADTARFGPAMAPDWDGTALADASPLHNGVGPATYTFGSGIGPPPPAALDRILYSDSRLSLAGSFVLNTTTLDAVTLSRLGLTSTDVLLNATTGSFDHLPVVADLRAR